MPTECGTQLRVEPVVCNYVEYNKIPFSPFINIFARYDQCGALQSTCEALRRERAEIRAGFRRRTEVTFRTKVAVDRFLADPVLKVGETEIHFEFRGLRATVF